MNGKLCRFHRGRDGVAITLAQLSTTLVACLTRAFRSKGIQNRKNRSFFRKNATDGMIFAAVRP
ncbi:hypothetical protein G6N74_16930 [Mesorhizobium sp. CGMCC 1.15528]|uniref:Uncharacterized protein n=1 Tax=Mesorhizobium zhangyense TaxID=1776730 RepID=A0A7C9R8M5_9HYPH|nr:hypothetical protein [Mesorhizobium zhangyense]NGN42755.1 hypothetical protein [Mesorhizobium zhangyense]